MLDRLRAVKWAEDWDFAFDHVKSRRVLFSEYRRRVAVWSQAHSAERDWSFVDVTQYLDPEFRLSPEAEAELAEFVRSLPNSEVRQTCSGAVRLAGLRARNPEAYSGLPDLYEPLVLFYERGGEFSRDDAGFIDLTGVRFRPGPLAALLGNPPVTMLGDTALDALDADGRITYYTAEDGQGPLLRRRALRDEQTDELFGRDLRWEPTGLIPESDEAVKAAGLAPLEELAAARLIGTIVAAVQGSVG
ncbi:hypothetical protein ACFXJO_35860 [Streptomyces lavendulae]|uniref:hypothetical protein n=1 Tax=Streptomyces TaxID=1883 RepID=UPI002476668B|nr:hypothetical protein [Streptomyces sp. SPB4]